MPRPVCYPGATILSSELFKMLLTGSLIRGFAVQTHEYTLGVKDKMSGSLILPAGVFSSVCDRLSTEPAEGSFCFAGEGKNIYLYYRKEFTQI